MAATAFVNGAVFDGHRYLGRGDVLVEDGKVVEVVPGGFVTGLRPSSTTEVVVDVAGGLICPGFTDAHVHPIQGGLQRMRCDLSALGTREEYLDAVAAYVARAARTSRGCWGAAGRCRRSRAGRRPPPTSTPWSRTDRSFLPNRDHHGAWVNSRALELAGIDRHTPDPADGRIERDADGNPTGTLHEGAMALVSRHAPATSAEDYYAALMEGQRYLHSVGVTAWQDAIVGGYAGMADAVRLLRRARPPTATCGRTSWVRCGGSGRSR